MLTKTYRQLIRRSRVLITALDTTIMLPIIKNKEQAKRGRGWLIPTMLGAIYVTTAL